MATQATTQTGGILVPLVLATGAGIGIWQLSKYLKDQAGQRETEKAKEETLKHELGIKKSEQNISKIEQKANFTGINGYNKKVTANPILLAKEAIRERYNIINLQSGKTIYKYKDPFNDVDFNRMYDNFMKTPVNALSVFSKSYTAYTGHNFFDDVTGFTPAQRETAKAVLSVAVKKYPAQWK